MLDDHAASLAPLIPPGDGSRRRWRPSREVRWLVRPVERVWRRAEDLGPRGRHEHVLARPDPVLALLEEDHRHVEGHVLLDDLLLAGIEAQVAAIRPVDAGLIAGAVLEGVLAACPPD